MKTINDRLGHNSVFAWVALCTGLLLLIPLIAMQFSSEINWTLSDFVIMGLLIFGTGSLFVLAARKAPKHRLIIAVVVTLLFLYLWAELAVGIFTNLSS